MASKKDNKRYFLYSFLVIMYLRATTATNIDCGGKPFHCINSTHFMICVDLGGGVSKTVDSFVIQCPSTTVCRKSNHFECEYPMPTTTESTIRVGDETNESETNLRVITVSPFPKTNLNTVSVTTQAEVFTSAQTEQQSTNKISLTSEIDLPNVITTEEYGVENLPTNSPETNILKSNDSHGLLKLPKGDELFQEITTSPISTQTVQVISNVLLDKNSPSDIINEVTNKSEISELSNRNKSQIATSSDRLLADTTTEPFNKKITHNFSEGIPNTTSAISTLSYLITSPDNIVKINSSYDSGTETIHDEILLSTPYSTQDLSINKSLPVSVHQITTTNNYENTSSKIKNLTSELYGTESNIQVTTDKRDLTTDYRSEINTSISNENKINKTDVLNRNNSQFVPLPDISLLDTVTDSISENPTPTISTLSHLITSTDDLIKVNTSYELSTEAKRTTSGEIILGTQLSPQDFLINNKSLENHEGTTTYNYLSTPSIVKNLTSKFYVTESNIQVTEAERNLSFDNKTKTVSTNKESIINSTDFLNTNNSHFVTLTDILVSDTATESINKNLNKDLLQYNSTTNVVNTTPTISTLSYFMLSTADKIKLNTSFESSTEAEQTTRNEMILSTQLFPQDLSVKKTSSENVHQETTTNYNYLSNPSIVKDLTSELYVTESNIQVTETEQDLSFNSKTEKNTSNNNKSTINNTDLLNKISSHFVTLTDISHLDTTTDSIGNNLSKDFSEYGSNFNTVSITDGIINPPFESSTAGKKTTRDEIILSTQLPSQDLLINTPSSQDIYKITTTTTTKYYFLNTPSIMTNLTKSDFYVTESNTQEIETTSSLSANNKIENTQEGTILHMLPEPEYAFNISRPTSKAINTSTASTNLESSTSINIVDIHGFISELSAGTESPNDIGTLSTEFTPIPKTIETNSETSDKFVLLTTQTVYLTSNSMANEIILPVNSNLSSSIEPKTKSMTKGVSDHVNYSNYTYTESVTPFLSDVSTNTKSLNRTLMDSTTESRKTSGDVMNTSLFSQYFPTVSTMLEEKHVTTDSYDSLDTIRTERSDLDTSPGTKMLTTRSEIKLGNKVERTSSSGNIKDDKRLLLQNQNQSNWIFSNFTMNKDFLNNNTLPVSSVNSTKALESANDLIQNGTFLKQVKENNIVLNNLTYTHMFLRENESANKTEELPKVSDTLMESGVINDDPTQKLNVPIKQFETPGQIYLSHKVTKTIDSSKLAHELVTSLPDSGNPIIKQKQDEIIDGITSRLNDSLHNESYNTSKRGLATLETIGISDYIINTPKQTMINDKPVTSPKHTEDKLQKDILPTTTTIRDAIQGQPGEAIPFLEVLNVSGANTNPSTDRDNLSAIEPYLVSVTPQYDFVTQNEFIETNYNQPSINTESSAVKVKTQSFGTIDTINVDVNTYPQNEISNIVTYTSSIKPVTSKQATQTPISIAFQHLTTDNGLNSMDLNIDEAHKVITEKNIHTSQSNKTKILFNATRKSQDFYVEKPNGVVFENSIHNYTTEPNISGSTTKTKTMDGTGKVQNDEMITSTNKSNKHIENNVRNTTINPITQILKGLSSWNKSTTNTSTSMQHSTQPYIINSSNINEHRTMVNNLTKLKSTETLSEPSTSSLTPQIDLYETSHNDGQQSIQSAMTEKYIKLENRKYDVVSKVKSSTINSLLTEVTEATNLTPSLGDIIKLEQYYTGQNITRNITPRELNVFSNNSNYKPNQSSNSFTIGTLNRKKDSQPFNETVSDSSGIRTLHEEKKLSDISFNTTKTQFEISNIRSTQSTIMNLFKNIDKSSSNISSEALNATKPHQVFSYSFGTSATEIQSLNVSEIINNHKSINDNHKITDVHTVNISKLDLNNSNTMVVNLPKKEKSDNTSATNLSTQFFNSNNDFYVARQKKELNKDSSNSNITVNEPPKLLNSSIYLESPTKVSPIKSISVSQDSVKYGHNMSEPEVKSKQLASEKEILFVTPTRPTMPNNSEKNKALLKRTIPALPNVEEKKSIDIVRQHNNNAFTCMNRMRGRYADKNDCRKFYICIGRVQHIQGVCPVNTVFSEIKKQCTKNLSHCMINNQFHCIQEGRFSDIINSNIYYICVKNNKLYVRFKLQCQSGYHLNRTSVSCEEDQVSQQQKSSMSIDSESNKASDQSTQERKSTKEKKIKMDPEKNICRHEGKFPHPDDCRKYYVCSKNSKSVYRRRTKKCDSDEVFHREKKKCVSDESYECK